MGSPVDALSKFYQKAADIKFPVMGPIVGVEVERKIMGRIFPGFKKVSGKNRRLGVNIPHGPGQQYRFKYTHPHSKENVGKGAAVAAALYQGMASALMKSFYSSQKILRVGLHISMSPSQNISPCRTKALENTKSVTTVFCNRDAATIGVLGQQIL